MSHCRTVLQYVNLPFEILRIHLQTLVQNIWRIIMTALGLPAKVYAFDFRIMYPGNHHLCLIGNLLASMLGLKCSNMQLYALNCPTMLQF